MGKTGFDVAGLEQVETAVVTLKHPTTGDELEGVTIEIYSPESEVFKAATTRMRARITDFLTRNRGAKTEIKQKKTEEYEMDRNISCIKSITGLTENGKPLEAKDACTRFGWVYQQATAAMDDQSNFIKGSPAK